jgi:hypothetical protein
VLKFEASGAGSGSYLFDTHLKGVREALDKAYGQKTDEQAVAQATAQAQFAQQQVVQEQPAPAAPIAPAAVDEVPLSEEDRMEYFYKAIKPILAKSGVSTRSFKRKNEKGRKYCMFVCERDQQMAKVYVLDSVTRYIVEVKEGKDAYRCSGMPEEAAAQVAETAASALGERMCFLSKLFLSHVMHKLWWDHLEPLSSYRKPTDPKPDTFYKEYTYKFTVFRKDGRQIGVWFSHKTGAIRAALHYNGSWSSPVISDGDTTSMGKFALALAEAIKDVVRATGTAATGGKAAGGKTAGTAAAGFAASAATGAEAGAAAAGTVSTGSKRGGAKKS